MKLAYGCNAYMKVSIEEAVRRVAGLGFETVELMAYVPHGGPVTTTICSPWDASGGDACRPPRFVDRLASRRRNA